MKCVETFPEDKCKQILLANNFSVDNLLITGKSLTKMNMYLLAFERMNQEGFTFKSWNLNSTALRNQMAADSRFVEHTCDEDKVLGCRFNVKKNTLTIAPCTVDPEANTKRKISDFYGI